MSKISYDGGPVGFTAQQLADWILTRRPDMSARAAFERAQEIIEEIRDAEDAIHEEDLELSKHSSRKTPSSDIANRIESLMRRLNKEMRGYGIEAMRDEYGVMNLPSSDGMRHYYGTLYGLFINIGDADDCTIVHWNPVNNSFGLFVLTKPSFAAEVAQEEFGGFE